MNNKLDHSRKRKKRVKYWERITLILVLSTCSHSLALHCLSHSHSHSQADFLSPLGYVVLLAYPLFLLSAYLVTLFFQAACWQNDINSGRHSISSVKKFSNEFFVPSFPTAGTPGQVGGWGEAAMLRPFLLCKTVPPLRVRWRMSALEVVRLRSLQDHSQRASLSDFFLREFSLLWARVEVAANFNLFLTPKYNEMCYLRCLYCCCCWHYVKTLTYNTCSQAKHCQRRTVYSKSLAICETCDNNCKKPCSRFEKIPRRWTEKKHEGYFICVAGFDLDCFGNVVILTSNTLNFFIGIFLAPIRSFLS